MTSVCETVGVVQLRRKKAGPSTPPNPSRVDSLLQQETQHDLELESCYDNDQYSDIGYPSLPRPKAVLSLPRKGLPWSLQQASKLSTIPIRVRSRTEGDIGAVAPAVKANRESNHTILAKHNKRKSLNVISDLCSGQRSSNGSGQSDTLRLQCASEMNNRARVHSKKAQASAAAAAGEEEGQKKSKKSRKPSKSLTFSFGSSSDKKRRALGFLGRNEKKTLEKTSPVAPNSPILVSRKVMTLPPTSKKSSLPGSEMPTRNGGVKSYHGSYQDITGSRRSLTRSKRRPPPLPSLSNSLSAQGYSITGGESPLQTDYSPALTSATSGMSSRQESSESLSYRSESSQPASMTSNPSSRGHSPNVLNSRQQTPRADTTPKVSRGGRKLSDPMMATPTHSPDVSPPQPGASTLKKRYTFCVRPSRISPEQGWVSGHSLCTSN